MTEVFTGFEVSDIRFPTSRDLSGSDAMNPDPDYSVAYVIVRTSADAEGHGFVFTIGHGTEIEVAAIRAVEPLVVGLDVSDVLADLGAFSRQLLHESHLRWLGPEKGAVHMAIGAVLNAVWDLYARRESKPLWKLLADMSPEQLVGLIDFRHISDALTPEEALELLRAAEPGRAEREKVLVAQGYPAYATSAGWLGYSDDKVARLVRQAITDGFDHVKIKVGLDPAEDDRRCRMVRELVGPAVKLSIDANQKWDVGDAVTNIELLKACDLYWVEEPTSPDDILGNASIARRIAPIRLATGEHVANRVMFKQFLATGAMGICQIDACRVAGVNENIAILLLAAKFGVPVCPHAGGVGLCEVVQHLSMFDYIAVSGSTEGRWTEFVDHLHEHFAAPVLVIGGRYQAPTSPGSGAEMLAESRELFRFGRS